MDLKTLISQKADLRALAEASDWAGLHSAIVTKNIPQPDTTMRTARWLMLELSTVPDPVNAPHTTEADIVLATLQASTLPRVMAAYASLCGDGIDLSDGQVQSMIDLLGEQGGWSADLISRVKQAGIRQVSLAEQNGLSDPTQAECQSAWVASVLESDWTTQQNETINPAVASEDRVALVAALNQAAINLGA